MGILCLLVVHQDPTVFVIFHRLIAFFFEKIQQDLLPDIAEISCDDLIVRLRFSSKIFQILCNRTARCRCHTCTHILGVFQSVVHHFSCGKSCDLYFSLLPVQHAGSASRNRPGSRQRSLASVAKRKTEFLLRRGKMAGCHRQHPLAVTGRQCDGSETQRLSHRGARTEQSVQRPIQFSDSKRGGNGLRQQIPGKDDPDILRGASCLFDRQPCRLLLQHALCFLPGILSQLIIRLDLVKKNCQRTFSFFLSNHRCPAFHIDWLFQPDALFSDLHLLPPFCHILDQSQHP